MSVVSSTFQLLSAINVEFCIASAALPLSSQPQLRVSSISKSHSVFTFWSRMPVHSCAAALNEFGRTWRITSKSKSKSPGIPFPQGSLGTRREGSVGSMRPHYIRSPQPGLPRPDEKGFRDSAVVAFGSLQTPGVSSGIP